VDQAQQGDVVPLLAGLGRVDPPPGTLVGSNSYDPDGDPITYEWTNIGPLPATIRNPSAARATVEFTGGFGRYEFQLTVTDDKGLMGMDQTVVFWVDP